MQEHLIEHSFNGCEDRGYSCYICSSVFTAAAGLQIHMVEVHGNNAKPYDCHLCSSKFFFRSELEHHVSDHNLETSKLSKSSSPSIHNLSKNANNQENGDHISDETSDDQRSPRSVHNNDTTQQLKQPPTETIDEEEEYIEVETLAETAITNPAKCTESSDDDVVMPSKAAANDSSSD